VSSDGSGSNSNRDDRDKRASASRAADDIDRARAAYKAKRYELAIGWLCSAIEEIVNEPPPVPTLKARERKRQIRERQRSSAPPHGEAARDAT
jgi:hypothetical protein